MITFEALYLEKTEMRRADIILEEPKGPGEKQVRGFRGRTILRRVTILAREARDSYAVWFWTRTCSMEDERAAAASEREKQ